MIETSEFLPDRRKLREVLALSPSLEVEELLDRVLLAPVSEFMARPSKRFRARLVETAALLSMPTERESAWGPELEKACAVASQIVEGIHAGSLIVDDIQDRSRVRRGGASMHLKYGVPVALNAGNWLYFWALDRLKGLGVAPDAELEVHRSCARILSRAHFGQAIDVGTPIDEIEQARVAAVCSASMELKTGTLLALAMRLGASVAGSEGERAQELERLGALLGVALQAFDDVGSFAQALGPEGAAQPKRFEDLYLRRPTGVWLFAAQNTEPRDYRQFVDAVNRLPNESFLTAWVEVHEFVARSKRWAFSQLERALQGFELRFGGTHPESVAILNELGKEMERSYG